MIQVEQVIIRFYIMCMHIKYLVKKESIYLKGNMREYMRGIGRRKGR